MTQKHKSSDAGNSKMPKKNCRELPVSKKSAMYRKNTCMVFIGFGTSVVSDTGGHGTCSLWIRVGATVQYV